MGQRASSDPPPLYLLQFNSSLQYYCQQCCSTTQYSSDPPVLHCHSRTTQTTTCLSQRIASAYCLDSSNSFSIQPTLRSVFNFNLFTSYNRAQHNIFHHLQPTNLQKLPTCGVQRPYTTIAQNIMDCKAVQLSSSTSSW